MLLILFLNCGEDLRKMTYGMSFNDATSIPFEPSFIATYDYFCTCKIQHQGIAATWWQFVEGKKQSQLEINYRSGSTTLGIMFVLICNTAINFATLWYVNHNEFYNAFFWMLENLGRRALNINKKANVMKKNQRTWNTMSTVWYILRWNMAQC